MGAIVTFDWSAFSTRYPEFESVGQVTASLYFAEATLYQRNDGGGPVDDPAAQLMLLNMVTAHLCMIYSGANGEAPSPLVGRVASAGEGSVNVSVANDPQPRSASWWMQTKYGAQWWAATNRFRRAMYIC